MFYNKTKVRESLYRNDYFESWERKKGIKGWELRDREIYEFFDRILHAENPNEKKRRVNKDDGEGDNLVDI
mgnify:CR=1 FL=1